MNRCFWISSLVKNNYFLLFVLWSILTAVNLNKAFHIDDTFHLEAAVYLQDHPTKPMSGFINWGDDPTPIYSHNQPPLFFYLIALFSGIFGLNEIPLHLFLSVFTLLALYFFQKITRLLSIQDKNTLLILFAFCPALIINQNLMVDVPILALILGMAYFLLKTNYSNKLSNYILASLFLGLGLFVKYSVLPLLVVLIVVIVLKRDYKKLFVVLIPIAMLSIWSLWNFTEYGSIHILDRPKGVIHINQFWAFLACLGSISVFTASFIAGGFRSKTLKWTIFFVFVVFIASIILFYFDVISKLQYSRYLNILFIVNGLVVCISLFMELFKFLKKGIPIFLRSDSIIIFLFLTAISTFLILFAPFISTRHILLVLPFVLLFGYKLINNAPKMINRLSLVLTIFIGLLLGISDWVYADYYRQMASTVGLPKDRISWSSGHWGWQWYSKKNGMIPYSTNQSFVKAGDYIIYPGDISQQEINKNLNTVVVDKIWTEANLMTLFSGNDFASLYNSSVSNPPWNLSKNPIDTIYICKIESIKRDSKQNIN